MQSLPANVGLQYIDQFGQITKLDARNPKHSRLVQEWLGDFGYLPRQIEGDTLENNDPRMLTELPRGHLYEDAA